MFKTNSNSGTLIGRFWKLIPLLLIGVAWFFRDNTSVQLDEHAKVVQQVQAEQASHEALEQENADQRESLRLLAKVELNQRKTGGEITEEEADQEEEEQIVDSAYADGLALQRSAITFNNLLKQVNMEESVRSGLQKDADEAIQAGDKYSKLSKDTTVDDFEGAYKAFDAADGKLSDDYNTLSGLADQDIQRSTGYASFCRYLAWICTLLGAAVTGDWKKVLSSFKAGPDGDNSGGGGTPNSTT